MGHGKGGGDGQWSSMPSRRRTSLQKQCGHTGQESWRQASLLRREPTLPVSFATTVVVGDLDGYLHFFSVIDGTPVARLRQGGAGISAAPVVIADRLYVQSDSGSLVA